VSHIISIAIKSFFFTCCSASYPIDHVYFYITGILTSRFNGRIKDARELEGKSTAVHAKLVSPDVALLDYDIKNPIDLNVDAGRSILLFPDSDSQSISQVDWTTIKRVIVIDGTWKQAKAIASSSSLSTVCKFHLSHGNVTKFWRYQRLGSHCLSTIEAIYQLYCERETELGGKDSHKFDNLLYFFSFFYHVIQDYYHQRPEKSFTSRHGADYIK